MTYNPAPVAQSVPATWSTPQRKARSTLEAEALVPATHAACFAVGTGILVAVLFGGWLTWVGWWSWEAASLLIFSAFVTVLTVFLAALYGGVALRWDISRANAGISVQRPDPDGPGPKPREVRWYFNDPHTGQKRMLTLLRPDGEPYSDEELYPIAVNALRESGSLVEERVKPRGYGWRRYRPLLDELKRRQMAENAPDGWQLTSHGTDLFRAFVADYQAGK